MNDVTEEKNSNVKAALVWMEDFCLTYQKRNPGMNRAATEKGTALDSNNNRQSESCRRGVSMDLGGDGYTRRRRGKKQEWEKRVERVGPVSTGWQIRCTVAVAVVAAKKRGIGKAREGRLASEWRSFVTD